MSSYTVSVGSFEGPFDLLLQLISQRRVDIHDISIAEITDDYLAVLRELEQVDLEVTTEFLVVAATLLELKTARLLPGEEDPELEELALEARDLLYARLLDYRMFSRAAGWIRARLAGEHGLVPRTVGLEEPFRSLRPPVDLGVDADGFALVAARAFAERADGAVDTSHVQPVRMNVRDAADLVISELARAGGRATFAEITAGCRHRVERIVCFLAVLELYKFELLDVGQATTFGDIVVTATSGPEVGLAGIGSAMDAYEGTPGRGTSMAAEGDARG